MRYKAYIFDLDGTLLDTLPDLVRLTNLVLAEYGWPQRTRDEILSFVGNGGRKLLERAAPESATAAELDRAFDRWQELYPEFGHAMTHPYEGIPQTLANLKAAGAKLGVLSNKFDAAANAVIAEHFPGVFDLVRGECADIPRKPDPTGLRFMMRELGVQPSETVFVGDSPTDIEVARNADTFSMAVTWGYRDAESLLNARPDSVAEDPSHIEFLC